MISWKKTGQTALSIGYFLSLFLLFAYIAIQGPLITTKSGPSSQSLLRDNLFPFSLNDFGLLESDLFAQIDFFAMILLGFMAAYLLGKTFKRLLGLQSITTLFITLIFLSPYYSPLVFGVHVINNGYAYPVFLMTIHYLLEGLVFKNFPAYIKFFLLSALAIILRRQFIFLPVVGFVALLYALILDREAYYGKKIYMILAFIASIALPDLSERYKNYLDTGAFIAVPFAGVQFAVTPLYVSKDDDAARYDNPILEDIFTTLRQPLVDEGLTEDVSDTDTLPLMLKFRAFFESYDTIAYERLLPLVQGPLGEDPGLVETGLIGISLALIVSNFWDYMLVYTHNIIYHMGGYFMTGLMLLILFTSFLNHIQFRGRFSLVALMISFITFANYMLVALIEPVTTEYGFYTDSLAQALLVALLAYLFRTQRGKNPLNAPAQSNWKPVENPS